MKKSLLLASSLALALGVGAAVGARQEKAQEVKADGNMRIYVDSENLLAGFDGLGFWYDGAGTDKTKSGTISGDNIITADRGHLDRDIHYLETASAYNNLYIKNAGYSDQWGPITGAANKVYQLTSWGNNGSYNTYDMCKVHVVDDATEYDEYYVTQWNAYAAPHAQGKSGYVFDKWYTDSTFETEFNGIAQDSGTALTTIYAHYVLDTVTYKATVNGHEYTLTQQANGGYDAQYSATINSADLVMGAAISFTANSAALSADPDFTDSNNVHTATKKVLETSDTNADLWLKKNGLNWEYWLGGRSGHYFIVNGSNFVPLAENGSNPGEYYTTGLNLVKDSTVKLYVTTNYDGKVKAGSQGASVQGGVITVDETGNYDLYYEPSEDNYIYFQQNHSYTVEFGIHEPVTLNEVDKGDYDAQYKATIEVSAGDVLSFKRDGVALTVGEDSTNQHNVFVPQHKVIESGTVDVYLKKSGDNWTYWLAGRTATYYLYTNASFVPLMVNPNNSNEVYATNVAMAANATVQIYEKVDAEDPTLNPHTDESVAVVAGGHIKVVTANSYNVYYNLSEKSLYIGNLSDADRAANTYADLFLETLSTGAEAVCEASGDTDPAKLATAWASLKTAFENIAEDNQVKEDAQGILKDANPNADTKVGHFAKLYDFIVHKYGSEAREDFVNRFNGAVVPPLSNSFTSPLFENNGGLVIVVVVATVAAISAGLFFILKKKETK